MSEMEDRANFRAMAREAREIRASLRSLRNWLDTSYGYALGDDEPEEGEPILGNGDDPAVFENAMEHIDEADAALRRAIDVFATAEGYRWLDVEYADAEAAD